MSGDTRGRASYAELEIHPIDRFLDLVDRRGRSECWPWLGGKSSGYGMFAPEPRGLMGAHRYAYMIFIGMVPEGMDLDHQCHSAAVVVGDCQGGESCPHRSCVNPWHLEPVTRKVNSQRGYRLSAVNDPTCANGHEWTDANRYVAPNGQVNCRDCNKVAKRRWYDKRRKRPLAPQTSA